MSNKFKLIILVIVSYIMFAVIPELFNFAPLPTGGWDWLSFIGIIVSIIFALDGIKQTIVNENNENRKQQQRSVLPSLEVNLFKAFDEKDELSVFRVMQERDGKLVNNGYSIYMIKNNSQSKKPDNFIDNINIKVKNVGLSTAFSINTFIYKLESVKGLDSLDDIKKRSIDDFYNKVKYVNYKYITKDIEEYKNWQLFTSFNLTNDGKSEVNLVFDVSKIRSEFYNIIKFEFTDIYDNKYYQIFYLYFDSIKVASMPISKVYSCKS